MKRAISLLAALVLVLLPAITLAECEHGIRPSEWVLQGYVDPQPGVPGYSGDFCCPICGAVMKKGEVIGALPIDNDEEKKETEREDPIPEPAPAPVSVGAEAPSAPAEPESAPSSQAPENNTERGPFFEQYPYRWVQMDPEPGIVAPAAGELIWSPDMETEDKTTPFSFRNGIAFGMTKEEIIRKEAENSEIQEDEWRYNEMPGWLIMVPAEEVPVSDYTAKLEYLLANDQLQLACYDFYQSNEKTYLMITEALSAVYGPYQYVYPSTIIDFMKSISQEYPYEEHDIRSSMVWELDNVIIYQWCYI